MKKTIILFILLLSVSAKAQPSVEWTPLLQQTAMYFSSDRVTVGGAGLGAGARIVLQKHFTVQSDANIFWANGNAVSTRLAAGYQRDGHWQLAILATFSLLWGQRTEVLSETGRRPAAPVWVIGLRGSPLRFQGSRGSVSALELGYGIGPAHGTNIEITILSTAINW